MLHHHESQTHMINHDNPVVNSSSLDLEASENVVRASTSIDNGLGQQEEIEQQQQQEQKNHHSTPSGGHGAAHHSHWGAENITFLVGMLFCLLLL